MNLTEWLQRLMTHFGAQWVMWLLVGLSVVSGGVMLLRAWVYWSLRDELGRLANDRRDLLRNGDVDAARKKMEASPSAEAAVVVAGLIESDHGRGAAEEAMQGAVALPRMQI